MAQTVAKGAARAAALALVGLIAAGTAVAQEPQCGPVQGAIYRIRVRPPSGPGGENVAGYALRRSPERDNFAAAVEYPLPLSQSQADGEQLIWDSVGPFDTDARHFIAVLAFRRSGPARSDSALSNVIEIEPLVSGPCEPPGPLDPPEAPFLEIIELLELAPSVRALERAREEVDRIERAREGANQ